MKSIQYTIRSIPSRVDRVLRARARQEARSFNSVLVEALTQGAGVSEEPVVHHDLDHLKGRWVEDPAFDEAIRAQDAVDPDLWK